MKKYYKNGWRFSMIIDGSSFLRLTVFQTITTITVGINPNIIRDIIDFDVEIPEAEFKEAYNSVIAKLTGFTNEIA